MVDSEALVEVGNCDTKDCISRLVLDVLSTRWGLLIMRQLLTGTKRNSELRHAIEGVSEKMLAQTLRELERVGLISRKSYPVVPPRVEYTLTPLGVRSAQLITPLLEFIEEQARAFYNASVAYEAKGKAGEMGLVGFEPTRNQL